MKDIEKERDYLIRYLRSKVFEIVQYYEPEALSNPIEVQKIMFEMVDVLSERGSNLLETQALALEGMKEQGSWEAPGFNQALQHAGRHTCLHM